MYEVLKTNFIGVYQDSVCPINRKVIKSSIENRISVSWDPHLFAVQVHIREVKSRGIAVVVLSRILKNLKSFIFQI